MPKNFNDWALILTPIVLTLCVVGAVWLILLGAEA